MNTTLGTDEKKIREDVFTANLILFWLKATYNLTNKRVTGHTPNTFMGIFPLGTAQIAQPLKTISSVMSSTKFHFLRLVLGVILFFVGLAMFDGSLIFGLILAILGLINILNSYTSTFIISNNAGQSTGYEISILEKEKVKSFVDEINTVIAEL